MRLCQQHREVDSIQSKRAADRAEKERSAKEMEEQSAETSRKLDEAARELRAMEAVGPPAHRTSLLLEILSKTRVILDSDVCPVCDQRHTDLKEYVGGKLESLSLAQSNAQKRLAELRSSVQRLQDQRRWELAQIQRLNGEIRDAEMQIDSSGRRIEDFIASYASVLGDSATLTDIMAYESERAGASERTVKDLSAYAQEISAIGADLYASMQPFSRQEAEISELEKELRQLEGRLAAADSARTRVEQFIDETQNLQASLSRQLEEVLEQFINTRTKEAFVDLFGRMARNRIFGVTIPDVRVRYHRPEVKWRAVHGRETYPGEGVLSQGELNTCGLALFLALATTQQRHLGFVLLDDPIQNMDDLHIEELAQVLKAVKDGLGWQIVIGLHERSVRDYLKRQLFPSKQGQSLISYDLLWDGAGALAEKDEVARFEPDSFLKLPQPSAA